MAVSHCEVPAHADPATPADLRLLGRGKPQGVSLHSPIPVLASGPQTERCGVEGGVWGSGAGRADGKRRATDRRAVRHGPLGSPDTAPPAAYARSSAGNTAKMVDTCRIMHAELPHRIPRNVRVNLLIAERRRGEARSIVSARIRAHMMKTTTVSGYRLSNHASARCQQRGVRRTKAAELCCVADRSTPLKGGREALTLTRKGEARLLRQGYPKERLSGLRGLVIVVADDTICTVLHGHYSRYYRARK